MAESSLPMQINEDDHNSARRLLKRLRVALIIWLIVFMITLVWFTLSAMM